MTIFYKLSNELTMTIEQIFRRCPSGSMKDDLGIFWLMSRPHVISCVAAMVCSLILSGINGAYCLEHKVRG